MHEMQYIFSFLKAYDFYLWCPKEYGLNYNLLQLLINIQFEMTNSLLYFKSYGMGA